MVMAASLSVSEQRKQRRRENFLAGRARSAHRLCESVESSIVNDNPASSSSLVSSLGCRRGCAVILRGLRASFDAVGLHPAKEQQRRVAAYPTPKKHKPAHRNIRGNQANVSFSSMNIYSHTHTHTHAHMQ